MKKLKEQGNPYNNNIYWNDDKKRWSLITKQITRMYKIKKLFNEIRN